MARRLLTHDGMIPTITLPPDVRIEKVAEACRHALTEFESLEPSHFALAHWLCNAYRTALVGPRTHYPFTLGITGPVERVIAEAQARLVAMQVRARQPDSDIVAELPPRVHIARLRDAAGATGFGPIDVRGAPLGPRVLSVFFADYLMRPEDYLQPSAA